MKHFPLFVAFLLAVPVGCQACISISDEPSETIRTVNESALIVWDSKSKVEHFVRRAGFQTRAKNFGFLVPTPSKPELGMAQDSVFTHLGRELLPKKKYVTQNRVDFSPFLTSMSGGGASEDTASVVNMAASDTGDVEVVEQKRVGDYNASVLRASDTGMLTRWLSEHKYAVSSDTREWLAPYVQKGYYLTAFQIASNVNLQMAQAGAVRLSFKTDAPFYPYRESKRAQTLGGGRSLRVFYVGADRVEGSIQNENRTAGWPAKTVYSAGFDTATLSQYGLEVPAEKLKLTAFEDLSSPRPGWGDLRFSPSSEQSELTPPPRIITKEKRVWIPLDIVALVVMGGILFWPSRQNKTSEVEI